MTSLFHTDGSGAPCAWLQFVGKVMTFGRGLEARDRQEGVFLQGPVSEKSYTAQEVRSVFFPQGTPANMVIGYCIIKRQTDRHVDRQTDGDRQTQTNTDIRHCILAWEDKETCRQIGGLTDMQMLKDS